jgi:hypothetical protein
MDRNCALTLKTMLSPHTLEELLTVSCPHAYSLAEVGKEETERGARQVIRLTFNEPQDRQRFRLQLRQLAETAPADAEAAATTEVVLA